MPLLSHRWVVVAATTSLLFLIFLVGTPFLISQLAKQWMLDNGGEQVQIQDVDFNPFTATLLVEGCEVKVNEKTTLLFDTVALDVAWWPLFKKHILVESISLSGLKISIDDQAEDILLLGGLSFPKTVDAQVQEETTEAISWLSGIDSLALNNIDITLIDDMLSAEIRIDRLELTGLSQWSPAQMTPLTASGAINGAAFKVKGDISPFAESPDYRLNLFIQQLPLDLFAKLAAPAVQKLNGRVSYEGELQFKQQGEAQSFNETGKIHLQQVELSLNDPPINISNTGLEINGRLNMNRTGTDLKLSLDSAIALNGIDASDRESAPSHYRAGRIAYEGSLSLNSTGGAVSFNQDGKLNVLALDIGLSEPDVQITNGELDVAGKMDFTQGAAERNIVLNSNITLSELKLGAHERRLELLIADNLELDSLNVEGPNKISLKALNATNLGVGQSADAPQQDAFQYVGRFGVSNIVFDNQLLLIDSIDYQRGHSNIRREADGKLRIVSIVETIKQITESKNKSSDTQNQEATESAQPLNIAIGRIRVDDQSKISFQDASVQPSFAMTLNFKTGVLENLDTRQPDQASRLEITGGTDRHTQLAISGDVKPFSKEHDFDLTAKITGLGLPAISSYTQESLGLIMDSGSMDADINMASQEKALDGQADLTIHQLEFKNAGKEGGLQSKIPVPLNVALDTLRDRNNTIKLKVPVSGDAGSPGFGLNDAISKALAGGVSKGALTYLKFALQPYGTLVTAAEYAGEAITKVRLDPVAFEPGQSALSDKAVDYLGKLAAMLRDRPQLAIKVCGVAVQADHAFLLQHTQQKQSDNTTKSSEKTLDFTPQLTEMASQRADIVRDFLINQQQAEAGRLVECQPRIVLNKEESQPRTDLLI